MVGLPAMRKKFGDYAKGLGWQVRQDVSQIREVIMAVEYRRLDQIYDGGGALAGTQS